MKQFLTLFVLLSFHFLAQGQDLQDRMQKLRIMNDFYEFLDPKEKVIYSKGFEHPINPIPIFRRVFVDRKSGEVEIEGIITMKGHVRDTLEWGYCCFDIVIGRLLPEESTRNRDFKYGKLYAVRKFGLNLLASDSSNLSGRDGYFRIKTRLYSNDVLFVGMPGRGLSAGVTAYYIGRLLNE